MARPKTKLELENACHDDFESLVSLVKSYTEKELQKSFSGNSLNRNVRDVIAHLYHWHLLMLDWYKVGMNGEKPAMPAKGYTWLTMPDLNKEIWKKYQELSLAASLKKLKKSHQMVSQIIANHTEEELFEKKRYKWTKTTSVAAYLISNTTSHYKWAVKIIKKGMK